MTSPAKIIPHPLHDVVPRPFMDDDQAERRKDEPETRINEIKDGLRWLESHGMTKEADEIWYEFYYGVGK